MLQNILLIVLFWPSATAQSESRPMSPDMSSARKFCSLPDSRIASLHPNGLSSGVRCSHCSAPEYSVYCSFLNVSMGCPASENPMYRLISRSMQAILWISLSFQRAQKLPPSLASCVRDIKQVNVCLRRRVSFSSASQQIVGGTETSSH